MPGTKKAEKKLTRRQGSFDSHGAVSQNANQQEYTRPGSQNPRK